MHYLPKLLNQRGMFQRLNTVLRSKDTGEAGRKQIERFLYRASCVITGIQAIYQSEQTAVIFAKSYIKQLKLPENRRIAISTEPLFNAYSQIHNAVSSLAIMQNHILDLAKVILGIKSSTPASLAAAMKKGACKYGFDSNAASLIDDYWNYAGKYIRDVRNIDEHYDALVDQTFFEYKSEPGQIMIFLPDNPQDKSPNSFRYDDEMDAADTIIKALDSLNKLMDDLCQLSGIDVKPYGTVLNLSQTGELVKGEERTLGLIMEHAGTETNDKETVIKLDTIEIRQTLPNEKGGNISVSNLKPDSEVIKD